MVVAIPPPPRKQAARGNWVASVTAILLLGLLVELHSFSVVQRSTASNIVAPGSGTASSKLYLTAPQRCKGPAPDENLPQLELVASWGSNRPSNKDQVTLLTQMNLERLDRLENQCMTWPHALAVAIYVPQLEGKVQSVGKGSAKGYLGMNFEGVPMEQAVEHVGQFHQRMQREGRCDLRMALYTEIWPDANVANTTDIGLYPVNAMRNRALQMVDTEAVLQLDVDFLVNKEFADELATKKGWEYVRNELDVVSAVVLPAFEPNRTMTKVMDDDLVLTWGKQYVMEAIRESKAYLEAEMGRNNTMTVFGFWHGATQTDKWLRARDYFQIQYTDKYEPYTIMLRKHVPWFDERFRGYHFNKIVGYATMSAWGVTLTVHPRGYVIHVPHPKTANQFKTDNMGFLPRYKALYETVREQLINNEYYPTTSFAQNCPLQPQ